MVSLILSIASDRGFHVPSAFENPHSHSQYLNADVDQLLRGSLPPLARKAFTDAIKCLKTKPSQFSDVEVPGARTLYDDFIAVHINQTLIIHADGVFLSWHRNYIHLFEQTLVNECGYSGTLPYWNWPLWAHNLSASPLFDASPYSLSGDGIYNATEGPISIGGNATFPRGTGGGCVVTGPFANTTLPFQHFTIQDAISFDGSLPANAFDYYPHCFQRDLNSYAAEYYTNKSDVDYLIYQAPDITTFQNVMSGALGNPSLGVHGGGHLTVGPDLFDFFTSPSDPAFWLHHGMIDLVWTMWQARDPANRQFALSGGSTTFNIPPSPNVTLSYVENWGVLGEAREIGSLMSVTDGPFCYRYDYS